MDDGNKKATGDEPVIDPALKRKRPPDEESVPPVGNTGQRRENETDANRDDGARKRAEEGL